MLLNLQKLLQKHQQRWHCAGVLCTRFKAQRASACCSWHARTKYTYQYLKSARHISAIPGDVSRPSWRASWLLNSSRPAPALLYSSSERAPFIEGGDTQQGTQHSIQRVQGKLWLCSRQVWSKWGCMVGWGGWCGVGSLTVGHSRQGPELACHSILVRVCHAWQTRARAQVPRGSSTHPARQQQPVLLPCSRKGRGERGCQLRPLRSMQQPRPWQRARRWRRLSRRC